MTGYSVARRPEFGEQPIWYGGGQLGRDLTLPRLRQGWPDTPTGASDAAAEWTAAKRHRRAVNPGRETRQPAPELWEQYGKDLDRLAARLRSIDPVDRDTWTQVARRTAGAFAAWSNQVEPTPGPIARASDNLARSAQTLRRDVDPKPRSMASIGNVAMLLASVAHGGQGPVAQMALLRQLAELARQLHHSHRQRNQTQRAQELASMSRLELNQIRDGLQGLVATGEAAVAPKSEAAGLDPDLAAAGDAALRGTIAPRVQGSLLPNQLNPDRQALHTHEPDGGIER
ncbi:hypothetical protein ACX8Z9_03235 [Arthrobacter halodurans]|uniref:Uncharacterized protein n=1 Tax=Arthrobacter halodurans TaxID=516699 RepID=A0ABV4UIR5_9MICC